MEAKIETPPNFVLFEGQFINGFEDIINAILSSFKSHFKIEISKVKITSNIRPMHVNFIFEEFTNPETLSSLNLSKDTTGKSVLVFTEFVTKSIFGRTFNAFNLKDRTLISREEKALYLRRRFNSTLKVLQNFKFDAIISMHPEINQNLSKLLKKTLNHNTNIISFYPLIPMRHNQTLTQNCKQKLKTEFDVEYYSKRYSEDLKLMPDGTPMWHFLRYGRLEKRVSSKFLESNILDFQQKQRELNDSLFLGETLKIFFSGSSNNHREATLKSVKESFKELSPLGFTGNVELVGGWDQVSYDIEQILNGGGYPFLDNGAKGIDLVVPQSPEWSFLSPIRIWRSFSCGLVPIYFTNHFDSHPLSVIVEQVRSTYPIYTLAKAVKNKDFIVYFSERVDKYNKLASNLNEDFFDLLS